MWRCMASGSRVGSGEYLVRLEKDNLRYATSSEPVLSVRCQEDLQSQVSSPEVSQATVAFSKGQSSSEC